MTDAYDKTVSVKTGGIFSEEHRVVIVHNGSRGPEGTDGDKGDQGDQGDSIVIRGPWMDGTQYCPGDAVTWRSTAAQGIQSLYIQVEAVPCSPSTVPPHLDLGRWDEVGATDLQNVTGAIWTIHQIDHEFEYIGTPVAFSYQAGRWTKADNRYNDEVAIAVVREVIDADRAVLQTTGEVPNLDPRVILPEGSSWDLGRLYYVSSVRGRVETGPELGIPTDPSGVIHPILIPTKFHESVDDNDGHVGVVLPWRPQLYTADYRVVGQLKFYYTATAGQTQVTGPDLQGNTLAYMTGTNTDVFLNGVNLSEIDDYTATDGVTIAFPEPMREGDHVEVWTPNQPLDIVVQSTAVKMDNIETLFDGVRTEFPITYDVGQPVALPSAPNLLIWIDANPQEAFTDYNTAPDPVDPASSILTFPIPPQLGDRFWGLIGLPIGDTAALDAAMNQISALEQRIAALEVGSP